jgi:hypothetical protein
MKTNEQIQRQIKSAYQMIENYKLKGGMLQFWLSRAKALEWVIEE